MPVSGLIPMVFAVSVTPNEAEMNTAQTKTVKHRRALGGADGMLL
jgi:hypothetical protein